MDTSKPYSLFAGSLHMAAGLATGVSAVAAGYAIGVVGDAGARALVKQPRAFVGFVLVLIFAEVLGMLGFVVAFLIMNAAKLMTCA